MEPRYLSSTIDEIEKKITNLNIKQLLQFSWYCCIESLPFLGSNKSFIKENKIKKQLFIANIFYAMDLIFYISSKYNGVPLLNSNEINEYSKVRLYVDDVNMVYYVNESLQIAKRLEDELPNACRASTTFYGKTVFYALSLIDKVFVFNQVFLGVLTKYTLKQAEENIVKCVNSVAKNAINTYLTNVDDSCDLNYVILDHIKILNRNETVNECNIDLKGGLWGNFKNILNNEQCDYFANIYEEIYESKLNVDMPFLIKRLSVPAEIRNAGATSYVNYIKKIRDQDVVHLNEARIIILGDKGVGKTSLARRLINPKSDMPKENESTAGVDTSIWKLREENLNVHVWDFAGHVVTHAVHQCFLSERCLYILVIDGRTEERNRLEYWLNHVKSYGGDSEIVILINVKDENKVSVCENYIRERSHVVIDFFQFSIKKDINELNAFREYIKQYIVNNPSWNTNKIPLSYYNVKEKIEDLFLENKTKNKIEYITRKEFENISMEFKVPNVDELLSDLHALGVALRYNLNKSNDTLILNPEWISFGIYKIINWVHNKDLYSISLLDFEKVFKDDKSRYPKNKYAFLFELMNYYELAYEIEEENALVIPHLLNEDRPLELPDFPIQESLCLKFIVSHELPLNTISRFIVRHNQQIAKHDGKYLVWKYGVVLEEDHTVALIREDDRVISILVKGPCKTVFIGNLRNAMKDIFSSYKSMQPELQYSLNASENATNESWISEKKLFNHSAVNMPYYDDANEAYINVMDIFNKYNISGNISINTLIIARDVMKPTVINESQMSMEFLRDDISRLTLEISKMISQEKNRDDVEDVKIQIAAIQAQLQKTKPRIGILKNSFETINGILSSMTANVSAAFVVDGINKVLQNLNNAFPY